VCVSVDWRQREWALKGQSRSEFEKCALALIPKQIPTPYVEGYKRLIDHTNKLRWPRCPKLIFTSNVLWFDTVSMAYIAERVEQGALLAYGQHGGGYGMYKLMWAEEHETAIADMYLTWGWNDNSHSNVTPIGMLKGTYSLKPGANSKANILLVLGSCNRYSAQLDS